MKNVLVTGGGGFIGRHIVAELLNWDYTITILDRLDETVNLNRLLSIPNWTNHLRDGRIKLVFWDLKSELNDLVSDLLGKPSLILHLASSSHVDRSVNDPLLFAMDNVIGTTNLLNWIRKSSTRPELIHVSTDEVFGETINKYYGFQEKDTLCPSNPYSATKASQEMLVRGFSSTYNLPATIVRLTNIIGPYQHKEKAIPTFIRKISRGELVEIHSDSGRVNSGTRYYLDYRDLCNALMCISGTSSPEHLSPKSRDQGVYHISGKEELSNLSIAQKLANLLGRELNYCFINTTTTRPLIELSYRLSCIKLYDLGWKPIISIDDSLRSIVNWYKLNQDWL